MLKQLIVSYFPDGSDRKNAKELGLNDNRPFSDFKRLVIATDMELNKYLKFKHAITAYMLKYRNTEIYPRYFTGYHPFMIDSKILKTDEQLKFAQNNLSYCKSMNLIYRASRDGFGYKDSERCYGKSNTVTIILTANNFVFGAYNHDKWVNIYG